VRRTASLLFAAVALLYVSFPTQNYYWDGIFFSQIIEEDPGGLYYLHANHLLYNPLGRLLWLGLNAVGYHVRALPVLQLLSSLTGAAAVAVLYCILIEFEISQYVAICTSLAFAFSATWWKFSTDANSYIPSTLLLLLSLFFLVRAKGPKFIVSGLFHSAAMLLHQLAVFFYPAAILAIWKGTEKRPKAERLKAVGLYTIMSVVPTIVTYVFAFVVKSDNRTLPELLRWVTSYSPDASFSFALGKNLATSLVGHVRLIFGGNLRMVMEQRSPVSMVAAVAVGITLLVLIARFAQKLPKLSSPSPHMRRFLPVLLVWWGTYALFLLVWLPHNTFYRLLYLPALILLVAGFLDGPKTTYNRFALCVAVIFLINFGFYIYPQSRSGTNPSVVVADEMRGIWKPGDVVYWDVYAADNRTIRYFSPEVEWRELWGRAYTNLLDDSFAHFKGLWFDSVALADYRKRDPQFDEWVREKIRIEESYEFPVGGHVVGFVKLSKKTT
jgi:hypothetical protein